MGDGSCKPLRTCVTFVTVLPLIKDTSVIGNTSNVVTYKLSLFVDFYFFFDNVFI